METLNSGYAKITIERYNELIECEKDLLAQFVYIKESRDWPSSYRITVKTHDFEKAIKDLTGELENEIERLNSKLSDLKNKKEQEQEHPTHSWLYRVWLYIFK